MVSKLLDKLKQYLELQADIMKLSLIERIAIVMSFTMFMALCTVFAITIFIFAGIALGSYLTEVLSSGFYAYAIVVGIYLLILLLIIAFKKQLTAVFADMFIKIMAEAEESIDKQDNDE